MREENMPDYSKAYIYIGKCKVNELVYIGSTTRVLGIRSGEHRTLANQRDCPLYNAMRGFGADKFAIRLIEEFPCANKYHLEQREFEIMGAYSPDKLYNKDLTCPFKRPDTGLDPRYKRGKIYAIVNSINDMVYIGSTIQGLYSRLSFHKILAKGVESPLYVAMRKYGVGNFEFSILERYPCESKEELERREMEIVQTYPPEILLNTTVTYGKHSQVSKDKITQGLLAASNHEPVVSTAILMTSVPRTDTSNIQVSRGCIYDAKLMKTWRFEWVNEAGKVKTKNASYDGPNTTRTYEEAYQFCLSAQNKTFPPEGTLLPDEQETPPGFPNRLKLIESMIRNTRDGYSVTELKAYCREAKLTISGSKVPVVQRLLDYYYPSPGSSPFTSPTVIRPEIPLKEKLVESITNARSGYIVDVLTSYCRSANLILKGTKSVLAQRLLNHHYP